MNFLLWNSLLLFTIFPLGIYTWDSIQLEVFDVVEEVQQNFYELLGISQEADLSQIKSAYRKLSLILHPDKNPEKDAAVKFRQLVAVYDILRSPEKRQYYNEVLVRGLPDWRSAVYYFRKAKRVTLFELSILLFFIISLGQYLFLWASYLERKYTLEAKRRGKQKKLLVEDISKPSLINTLPVQLPLVLWHLIFSIPLIVFFIKEKIYSKITFKKTEIPSCECEEEVVEYSKPQRRKYIQDLPDYSGVETPNDKQVKTEGTIDNSYIVMKEIKRGAWSEEEMSELSKLIKKFPGGTPGRWDQIADAMSRSVDDVTKVMKSIRQNSYKIGMQSASEKEMMEKIKPQNDKVENLWTQQQQQALEKALQQFSKNVSDRWSKIAEHVPNKSKEECILRYKYLVETVKRQKMEKE